MAFDLGEYTGGRDPKVAVAPLSWRLDPEISLSDWTIQVNPVDGGDRATYHVHRAILGVAPRRSDYFAKAFSSSDFFEATTRTTELSLERSAVDAFPIFLDFLYTGNLDEATTELAAALRHCATYFAVPELYESSSAFIQGDLSVETAPTYLTEGATYADEKLQAAALKLCIENFPDFEAGELTVLPPPLFVRVVEELPPPDDEYAEYLSKHVASYCRAHPEAVDAVLLHSLTPADKMPAIAPSEAMFLLELSLAHACADDGAAAAAAASAPARQKKGGKGAGKAGAKPGRSTSTLRARCAAACASAWREVLTSTADAEPPKAPKSKRRRTTTAAAPTSPYSQLPADVKIELLEAALGRARADLDEREQELSAKDGSLCAKEQELVAKQDALVATQRVLAATRQELSAKQTELTVSHEEVRRFVRAEHSSVVQYTSHPNYTTPRQQNPAHEGGGSARPSGWCKQGLGGNIHNLYYYKLQ